jgi:hypothetical protein
MTTDSERASGETPPAKTSLGELALLFLRLGTTAFGGPAAHIALMRDEMLRRRKGLTEELLRPARCDEPHPRTELDGDGDLHRMSPRASACPPTQVEQLDRSRLPASDQATDDELSVEDGLRDGARHGWPSRIEQDALLQRASRRPIGAPLANKLGPATRPGQNAPVGPIWARLTAASST